MTDTTRDADEVQRDPPLDTVKTVDDVNLSSSASGADAADGTDAVLEGADKMGAVTSSTTTVNSSGSSVMTISSCSQQQAQHADELNQSFVTELLQRANDIAERDSLDPDIKEIVHKLANALGKSRAESNQYKLHAQLLSLTSKDQDMRYEVEQELVKREVDRLKTQGDQVGYLMSKVTRQKQLIIKYKGKIVEKNKEIIRLRSILRDKSQLVNGSPDNSNMLDTLGLLASQVLTHEEASTQGKSSAHNGNARNRWSF